MHRFNRSYRKTIPFARRPQEDAGVLESRAIISAPSISAHEAHLTIQTRSRATPYRRSTYAILLHLRTLPYTATLLP